MSEQPPATRFAGELRRLYQAAGSPDLASLVRQGQRQMPRVVLKDATLSDWFNGVSVPSRPEALRFLVEFLEGRAQQHGDYVARKTPWWEQLRAQAWAQTHAKRGGRRRTRPVDAEVGGAPVVGSDSVGGPVVRSAYLQQVRRIAPQELTGRETELAELAEFCSQPRGSSYQWWRAPAWSGKSALMSWFVLHPPAGVRLVSFFITARLSGQGDRVAFAEVVLEQLADLLSLPMPAYLTDANREAHLFGMLDQAARACSRDGQRLVLIVDGLDEDLGWTTSPDAHSVAALLPASPPAGMRIIVAGRPDPPLPADVPADHPLRDPAVVRRLAASPHAEVVKHDAQRELKRLLGGMPAEQQLLGLVAAAGGGLSGADLAELTGYAPQEIEDHLQAVSGRTFRSRVGHWLTDTPVYVLGHEELQQTATRYLGPARLERYRQQLHEWADRYRANQWPRETPEYLLRGYYRLLQAIGDLTRMIALATDPERHDRMLDITGGDSAALGEIVSTQAAVLAGDDPDLATMARLAVHRDAIRQRNSNMPSHLATVWAQLGHVPRAEALARSMAEPSEQARALRAVARVVAEAGDLNRAEQLALSITAPDDQISALITTATTAVSVGDVDRARVLVDQGQSIADLIPEPWAQARALVSLAQCTARLGDRVRSEALTDRAESAARSLTRPFPQQQELSWVAEGMARVGDLDRAERLARSISEPYERILLLGRIAQAASGVGDLDRIRPLIDQAESLAVSVSDPRLRAQALALIAKAAAEDGEHERGCGIAEQAVTAARTITEPQTQASVLAWIADALTSAGKADRAAVLVDEAELVARSIDEESPRASALEAVASAAAQGGDIDRAEAIIRSIGPADARRNALTYLTQVAASAGDVDRAEALARSIGEPYQRVQMLALVAEAMIHTSQSSRAIALANEAETTARATVNAESRAESLAALTAAMIQASNLGRAATFAALTETYARLIAWPATRMQVLAKAAEAMVRIGDHDRAAAVAESIEDPHERAQLVSAVTRAMARSGECDRAEALALSIADPLPQVQILAGLATTLADVGDLDRARVFARAAETAACSIEQRDLLAAARSCLAEAMANVGELDRAETLAYSIHDPFAQVHALVAVAKATALASLPYRAEALLDHAEGVAGSIKEAHLRVQALAAIVPVTIVVGARQRLLQLVDLAEAAARSVRHEMQAQLLALVAVTAAQAGDLGRAEKLARAGTSPSWQSHARTLATVAEAMVVSGDPDRAERLAASISANWRSHIQAEVVKAMSRTGNAGSAERLAQSIINPDLQAEALATVAAVVDPPRAQRLLGQALHLGGWARAVPVLAQIQPDVAVIVADEVALLGQRNQPTESLVSGTTYHPTLKFEN